MKAIRPQEKAARDRRTNLVLIMATMRKAGGTKRKTKSGKSSEHTERRTPKSPMLAQHQQKAGLESKVTPRPRFEADSRLTKGNDNGIDSLDNSSSLVDWRGTGMALQQRVGLLAERQPRNHSLDRACAPLARLSVSRPRK